MINRICSKRSLEYYVIMMVTTTKSEIFKIILISANFLHFFSFHHGWLNVATAYSAWFWSSNENKMCRNSLHWTRGGNGDLASVMFWVETFFSFKIGTVESISKPKVYILLLIYLVLNVPCSSEKLHVPNDASVIEY